MNNRIDYIDSAKGIGILLVIIGHTSSGFIRDFIYTFHMPLFFIISGALFKYKSNINLQQFSLKKAKFLLLPCFFFTIFYYIINYLISLDTNLTPLLKDLPGALWFLPILFITEILCYILINSTKTKTSLVIYTILLIYLGHIINYIPLYIPYSLKTTFSASSFFLIGYLNKSFIINNKLLYSPLSIILGCLILLIALYLTYTFNVKTEMYRNEMAPLILGYILAIIGSYSIILLSNNIFNNKIINFFGKNSLIVMGVHTSYYNSYDVFFREYFNSNYLFKMTQWIFTFLLCWISIIIINKHLPFIIGKPYKTN